MLILIKASKRTKHSSKKVLKSDDVDNFIIKGVSYE